MSVRIPVRLRTAEDYARSVHGSARQLTADERLIIDTYAAAIVGEIQQQWPAQTGFSRERWRYTLGAGAGYGFTIHNDASYVEHILSRGSRQGSAPLYLQIVPAVVRAFQGALLRDLQEAIEATEARLAAEEQARRARGGVGGLARILADLIPIRTAAPRVGGL